MATTPPTPPTPPQTASYGAWDSPITADLIVSRSIGLGQTWLDGDDIYWEESRPAEGGRTALVRRGPDGNSADVIAAPFNARTRVHEYGGGGYTARDGVVYFANLTDQRLYRVPRGGEPQPITPEGSMRYADFRVDAGRNRLLAVREDHTDEKNVVNTLVSLDISGPNAEGGRVLVSGNDFYANPRLSPDGSTLAWLTWNHPNMPWDGTELWLASVAADGSLADARLVAGGMAESIFQPEWSPDGQLYFISDRTGWWNLYRLGANGDAEPLAPREAEFGGPQWVFGLSTYAFADAAHLYCTYSQNGSDTLARLDLPTRTLTPLALPYSVFGNLRATPETVLFLAGSPTQPAAIVRLDPATGATETLRRASTLDLDPAYLSVPEDITFPTTGGLEAHGLYYRPRNPDFVAPAGELPPLLVFSHGGPTSATSNSLSLGIQFWTSRGFAVLDVNYGGSTGYGRAYRQRLNGQWGVVDLDDCVNGALYLAERGEVDRNKLAIRGGSAGGYTTLSALTFRDVFKAGASYFGVGDLEALATDTHKFESRYLDSMVGPYPALREVYIQRSPIHFTDQLSSPVIFFQGLEDRVVPPNQAEQMVAALRAKGVPVAYLTFPGEGHGFRRAENQKRSTEAELYFYGRVFGFTPAGNIEPVEIENM